MKKLLSLIFTATITCITLSPIMAAAEPLKVAFIYVSPIGDAGWTYQHDLGRLELEKNLGDQVEVSIIESVPEGPAAERVIRKYASKGYGLIFATSFGYMNPTIKVAKQFPNVKFEHSTGYKRADNVSTYTARFYEPSYLSGIVAASMSGESESIGYVAAFPVPDLIRGINAFTIGAQSVNPDIKIKVVWVNSWYDPGKEREATEALISQGVNVVANWTDSTAPTQAAQDNNKYAVAFHSDMSKYGPKAHLTSSTHLWGEYYTRIAQSVIDGTWKSGHIWGGFKENMVDLAPLNEAVPADIATLVEKQKLAITNGDFHPFTGPLKDQSGKVRLEAGTTMPDEELAVIDWFVEGVEGSIPK